MPSFNVNIVPNTTPAVQINVQGGTTYGQFKNSLGDFDYKVSQTYVFTDNLAQIQGNFRYLKYDVNGNRLSKTVMDGSNMNNSLYTDGRRLNQTITKVKNGKTTQSVTLG